MASEIWAFPQAQANLDTACSSLSMVSMHPFAQQRQLAPVGSCVEAERISSALPSRPLRRVASTGRAGQRQRLSNGSLQAPGLGTQPVGSLSDRLQGPLQLRTQAVTPALQRPQWSPFTATTCFPQSSTAEHVPQSLVRASLDTFRRPLVHSSAAAMRALATGRGKCCVHFV